MTPPPNPIQDIPTDLREKCFGNTIIKALLSFQPSELLRFRYFIPGTLEIRKNFGCVVDIQDK